MNTPTAAGWYDDPERPDQLRYFDGVVWTRHTTPRSTRATPAVATQPVAQPGPAPADPNAPSSPHDPYGWRPGSGPVGGPPPQQQWPQQPSGQQQPGQQGQQEPGQQGQWQQPGQPQQQWQQPGPPQQQWQQPGPPQQHWQQGPPQQQWQQGPPQQWGGYAQQPSGPTTPDGVALAGWWQRVGAYLIDAIITGVLGAIFGGYFLMQALGPWLEEFGDAMSSGDSTSINAAADSLAVYMSGGDFVTFLVISTLVGLIYNVGFWTWKGATPGKMALGISVRERERPGPPSLAVALRRYLLILAIAVFGFVPGVVGFLTSLVGLANYLWPLWDSRNQALHDKIGGTNVVRGKAAPKPAKPTSQSGAIRS